MKNLEKLMMKKRESGDSSMSPEEKDAKMSMLQALRQEMSDMMKDDLTGHGMKKVEVAAPDDEKLKMGLDKAKEMLHDGGEADSSLPESEDSKDWEDEEKEEGSDPAYSDEAETEHEDVDMPEHASEGEEDSELSPEEEEILAHLQAKSKKSKMKS